MENKKSSMTSLIASFARAYHSKNNKSKIFDDYLAEFLIKKEEYQQIAEHVKSGIQFFADEQYNFELTEEETLKWIVQTQLAPTPLARSTYCEEMFFNEIKIGCRQYVILGAGMDTFVFRNKELLKHIDVFELDHPMTQQFKRSRIEEIEWDIPLGATFVPVDFREDDFTDKLIKSGYDKNKKTFFSWLGVSYYLTEQHISDMLKKIAGISSEGSALVFDYGDENLFNSGSKRVNNMILMAQAAGEPMKTCFNYTDLEKILEKAGFLIYEHLSCEDIDERYFKNRSDYLHAFEHINYVLAVVK